MLADRFGLPLSTSSSAARDAYVDATERALTSYLGSRRLEEAKRLLGSRRPSASGVPVAGIGAVQ